MAEQHAPELAGWVAAEAEQFLAALPAPEPAESDAFLAELRSELPGEWADRAEAIYRRHLRSRGHHGRQVVVETDPRLQVTGASETASAVASRLMSSS